MRFRTLALALALACGVSTLAEAKRATPHVQKHKGSKASKVKPRKAKGKGAKVKRIKPKRS